MPAQKQSIPKLTEKKAIDWISQREWKKGQPYAKDGSLDHLRVQGMALKAECWGTSPTPYRVKINFSKSGIKDGQCSCPVGFGCKHMAALLYVWVNTPAMFTETDKLDDILQKHEKATLISLIKKMIDKHPDLERIIELQNVMDKPLTETVVRKQIRGMLKSRRYDYDNHYNRRGYYDEYDDEGGFDDIEELIEKAETYLEEPHLSLGKHKDANIIFRIVADEMMADYEEYGYGTAESIIDRCADGLGECLSVSTASKQRSKILTTMFHIYSWDVKRGGYGIGSTIPETLATYVKEEERILLQEWIKSEIAHAPKSKHQSDYRKGEFGRFLLELEDNNDDEAYLKICLETGRHQDAIQKLLELKRIDEATELVQRQDSAWSTLNAVKLLINANLIEEGRVIIEEAYQQNPSHIYQDWLIEHETLHKNFDKALDYTLDKFWKHSTLYTYTDIERRAKQTKTWKLLKPKLIQKLKKQKAFILLCEIYIHDKDIDNALDSYQDLILSDEHHYHSKQGLQLQLAKLTEKTQPLEAMKFYKELLENILDSRNRAEYATSVEYLKVVKSLYKKQKRLEDWKYYYESILLNTKQLRAFKKERERLGLTE